MRRSFKGRGALSNPPGRFDKLTQTVEHDGWYEDALPDKVGTVVSADPARSIISRNQSPDIGFSQSINPYRGCAHGCIYCLDGETSILMADGNIRRLADIHVGDEIYGTKLIGSCRRYVKTQVLAHWSVIKPAYRITLEDGTELISGPDHRFLTERGWKFVTGRAGGPEQRPHLSLNDKLMGTGRFARAVEKDADYRLGYLCGVIRGDGLLASHRYEREGRGHGDCDQEALDRTRHYLARASGVTHSFLFAAARSRRQEMRAIRTHSRASVEEISRLIAWPHLPTHAWQAGFLAGIFDAEGSYNQGVLRFSNTDFEIIEWISKALGTLGFGFVIEHIDRIKTGSIDVVRITGGFREHLRFFHTVDPAIRSKRDFSGYENTAQLAITRIEPLGKAMRLYDITTGTEDFIANGVISHNCYARPSHNYIGLSPGLDFETRLFYKADAAKLLEKELQASKYRCSPIMLGANTDPYQPLEKTHKVTRSILEVMARCRHPVTITTKSALVARDVDLLADLARDDLTQVMFSIPTLDDDIKRILEPRASSAAARLKAMRVLSEAGVPVGVLVAPIIPVITEHEIEAILEASRESGASAAGYTLLRLPWEVKDLFREWLAEHFPDRADHVMSQVRRMRGERDNDPEFGTRMHATGPVAELIRQRFQLASRRLGFGDHERTRLPTNLFRPPVAAHPQMSLELPM